MRVSTFLKTPYNYFLLFAILSLFMSFLVNDSIDIHLHDTYFVISTRVILWTITAILFFVWGIYTLLKYILLFKWLSWLHILASVIAVGVIFFIASQPYNYTPKSRVYYNGVNTLTTEERKMLVPFAVAVILFFFGQLAFVVNTIGGIIKYLLKRTTQSP